MMQASHQPYPMQPVAPQQAVPGVPYATTLYTAGGSPVQIVNVNTGVDDGTYQGYRTGAARILGWLQTILGIVTLLAQIIVTSIHAHAYLGFSGFWAGIIFIIAGAFGIQSAKTKSQCAVVTTLVMSIIAAVISIGPITQGAIGVNPGYCYRSYYYDYSYGCGYTSRDRAGVAFHAIMLICGIAEGIVATIAAAYCCHGCCCHTRPGVVLSPGQAGVAPLPLSSGGMQVTTVQYQPNTGYYPAPVAPGPATYPAQAGGPATYPAQAGALPAYSASAPPPQYTEKV